MKKIYFKYREHDTEKQVLYFDLPVEKSAYYLIATTAGDPITENDLSEDALTACCKMIAGKKINRRKYDCFFPLTEPMDCTDADLEYLEKLIHQRRSMK